MLPNLWKPPIRRKTSIMKYRFMVMYPTDAGKHIQVPYKSKKAAMNLAHQMMGNVFSLEPTAQAPLRLKERIFP